MLNGLGNPVDLLVGLYKTVLYLADVEIICIHRLVDKGSLTSPAVRIVMLDGTVGNSLSVLIKEADDNGVHLDNVLFTLKRIEICYFGSKATLRINGIYKRNSVVLAGPIVVLTECGGGMNDTNTLVGSYIVSRNDTERALFGKVCKIGEERLIGIAYKLGSETFLDYNGLRTEYVLEVGKSVLTRNVDLITHLNVSVGQLLTYRKAEVRGECPGCSRPCKEINGLTCLNERGLELDRYPSVLTGTGGV